MTSYTIKIHNQSQMTKSYVVFMEPPSVTPVGGAPPIFTNAWATFENITDGGWDQVNYTDTTYAYWSQTPRALSPGVPISSGGVTPVSAVTQDAVNFTNTSATGFLPPASPGAAQNGSFQIQTGGDFTPQNNFVFGLARDNGGAIPSPVATFPAAPNETYNVTPVIGCFYVANGDYTEGQVIDASAVSANAAAIDFTGKPDTTATATQNADGSFTVEYS